jgi:hypothetical protein
MIPTNFTIFLDIDGVLFNGPLHWPSYDDQYFFETTMHHGAYLKDSKKYPVFKDKVEIVYKVLHQAAQSFDRNACANLENLIKRINHVYKRVSIVLSSSWRVFESLETLKQEYFQIYSFSQYLIDITPTDVEENRCNKCNNLLVPRYCRASKIHDWLFKNQIVKDFMILDDIDDHLSINFPSNYYPIDFANLLTEQDVKNILHFIGIS